jgi:hypothetical protein
MPPPPSAPPGTPPKQQRISTGLPYPDKATEALQMAELLGSALERHRLGDRVFQLDPLVTQKERAAEGSCALKSAAGRHHWPGGHPHNL